jgi:3-phenylpropionate/trans-cinnamate dioxygenase ferredoxin component
VPVYAADAVEEGAMVCTEVHGRRVLLARSAGRFFAVDEMCTHEDASLCLGALQDGRVKCPLHGSWFDLATGQVDDEPATEALRIYPIRVASGMIEIDLRAACEAP